MVFWRLLSFEKQCLIAISSLLHPYCSFRTNQNSIYPMHSYSPRILGKNILDTNFDIFYYNIKRSKCLSLSYFKVFPKKIAIKVMNFHCCRDYEGDILERRFKQTNDIHRKMTPSFQEPKYGFQLPLIKRLGLL